MKKVIMKKNNKIICLILLTLLYIGCFKSEPNNNQLKKEREKEVNQIINNLTLKIDELNKETYKLKTEYLKISKLYKDLHSPKDMKCQKELQNLRSYKIRSSSKQDIYFKIYKEEYEDCIQKEFNSFDNSKYY